MDTEECYHPIVGKEFNDALHQFAESPFFAVISKMMSKDSSIDEQAHQLEALKRLLTHCTDVHNFQSTVMFSLCQKIVQSTMTEFTCSGTEYLDGNGRLFIANHRDIMLDAMLLQYILLPRGFDTTHIVIGDNLFATQQIVPLVKLNKLIPLQRSGTPRKHLAELMRMAKLTHRLIDSGESVWIAQRGGRTKNGIDHTEPSLIKIMALANGGGNPVQALADLRITPVSISYEWEPCDSLKARETILRQQGPYIKSNGEDTESIARGISDFKGRVHLAICQPITFRELSSCGTDYSALARIIDDRIARSYRLWPNSYIAADRLNGITSLTSPRYTPQQAQEFDRHVSDACIKYGMGEPFRQALLGIYAGPL